MVAGVQGVVGAHDSPRNSESTPSNRAEWEMPKEGTEAWVQGFMAKKRRHWLLHRGLLCRKRWVPFEKGHCSQQGCQSCIE